MRDFLAANYGIHPHEKTVLDGWEGFKDANYIYFTISAKQKEVIHMEQAALAYYLMENNYTHMSIPIPNSQGEWYTKYNGQYYMILRVNNTSTENQATHGEQLAAFHITGSLYQYEPQTISSYGQWKTLWIEKMEAFEKAIELEAKNHWDAYDGMLMDFLPYIIGISENAIQYMQESETEQRFHESDQSTIVFSRYRSQLRHRMLWMNDLAFDHPSRDLAEYIRLKLIEKDDPMTEIRSFLDDYQRVRPLSILGWRLLYARLLYPIHVFDVIERGFSVDDRGSVHTELSDIIKQQSVYEKRLGLFFENAGIDCERLQIPVLHWL
ncbi:spore coat protein YutH [Lentibacillus kapialis]|uniref:Spore coat protein YutH n=1 Tax=Lentibacillus kapialis TaxID=340214 RepID=A0A917Q1E4_9BACI|nr:spore coat protein YutH [Lentibacillus kapialis]